MNLSFASRPAAQTATLREALDSTERHFVRRWLDQNASERDRGRQLSDLSPVEVGQLALTLGPGDFGRVLGSVTPETASRAVKSFGDPQVAESLQSIGAFEAADILRALPQRSDQIIDAMREPQRHEVSSLLRWDVESVGANMTTGFLQLPEDISVSDTMVLLRGPAKDVDVSSYIYLVDRNAELTGAVSFRGLLTAQPQMEVGSLSRIDIHQVPPWMDREDAAQILNDYDLAALPVTENGQVLGVLTADRAADILEVEFAEDLQMMGSSQGAGLDLDSASILQLFRGRIVWLIILVFGNIFSALGIARFEDLIASMVALVFFLPLLIGSGGNAGSQSATLVVRGLATGEILLGDWWRMIVKEFSVALLLGLTMAFAVSSLGFLRGGPELALVVSLTMIAVVMMGSLLGLSLPFLLRRFGLDPASASAPLITSLVDGFGVLIYFGIATAVLL